MAIAIASAMMIGSMGYAMEQDVTQEVVSPEQNSMHERNNISISDIAVPIMTGITSAALYYEFFKRNPDAALLVWIATHTVKNYLYYYKGKGIFSNKEKALEMDALDTDITITGMIFAYASALAFK